MACVCIEMGMIVPLSHFNVLIHLFIVLSFVIIFLIISFCVPLLLQPLRLLLHPALVPESENCFYIPCAEHAQVLALNIFDREVIGSSIALGQNENALEKETKPVFKLRI